MHSEANNVSGVGISTRMYIWTHTLAHTRARSKGRRGPRVQNAQNLATQCLKKALLAKGVA
eukprot:2555881-Alexandrium_andersonii.AAC.1